MLARFAARLNRIPALVAVASVLALAGVALGAPGDGPRTQRVSVSSSAAQGPRSSYGPSLSGDGRLVAFSSSSSNLVPGDKNGKGDVFVRDLKTDKTKLVSVNSAGAQGNRSSLTFAPTISSDGRHVAFSSRATNLAAHDGNDQRDAFVRDLENRKTTLVSVGSGGTRGNGASSDATISADGNDVAFASRASNLTAGDGNGLKDIFVRQRDTHRTLRVSVGPAGEDANGPSVEPAISGDGNRIVFTSTSSNLVPEDTDSVLDVFVRDLRTHRTILVSLSSSGEHGNASFTPAISGDGRFVAFESFANNLVPGDDNHRGDVFLRDLDNGTTTRLSDSRSGAGSNGTSYPTAVSAHGEFVVFVSNASNLVARDTNGVYDCFIRDVANHTTRRISVSTAGRQADRKSFAPTISADGHFVGFGSNATNLVTGDTNGKPDVFVRGPLQR